MKKAFLGLAAVGAVIGLRPVVKRMSQRMYEHCFEMAAQCKQMATQPGSRRQPVGKP